MKRIDLYLAQPIDIMGANGTSYNDVCHIDTTREGDEYIEDKNGEILYLNEMDGTMQLNVLEAIYESILKRYEAGEPTTINHRGKDVPALTWKGWDVRKLYNEYLTLLYEHEGDTDVTGESRESFLAAQAGDKEDTYFAMAYNAWDELCSRYDGLRDSGLDWYCGASTVGFPNEFDIYIGTGNENDQA